MREALGLVETKGLSTAILVADAMSKTANINIIDIENSKGLGYMTIKICGDVGAVNAAVTCGKQIAIENNSFVTAKVIPRPSNGIEVTFCQLNKEDVAKEITTSEKENSNNEESVSEIEHEYKGENVEQEIEPLNNAKSDDDNLDEKAKEESTNLEEESNKEKESPADPISVEQEVSSNEKSKTRRSSRKKAEPKKNED